MALFGQGIFDPHQFGDAIKVGLLLGEAEGVELVYGGLLCLVVDYVAVEVVIVEPTLSTVRSVRLPLRRRHKLIVHGLVR